MITDKKRLLVIDANSVIHRAYHALPSLTTKKGELVNAVYGFLLVFLKATREFRPDFIAACFDFPAPSFRVKIFKEYKAKRPPAPPDLYSQIPIVKEALETFNVAIFEKEGFEADDLIGGVCKRFSQRQVFPEAEIIILSGDLDILQLVDKKTRVFFLRKGVKDTVLYDEKAVQEKYGFPPEKIVDYKALRGDPSDNIPGAPGVGEKTASELIKSFGSVKNLYQKIESGDVSKISPKLKELLLRSKEQVLFCWELANIRKDAPFSFDPRKKSWERYDKERTIRFLEKLGFYSLINRLSENETSAVRKHDENGKINKGESPQQHSLF